MDEMLTNVKLKSSSNKLIQLHRNIERGNKAMSYLGSMLWNNFPFDTKTSINPNSVKMHYFELLTRKDTICFVYY